MKLSVSLTEADVAALDRYIAESGLDSRSAVVQHAIRMLSNPRLEAAYVAAWDEWSTSDDAALWEGVVADGVAG